MSMFNNEPTSLINGLGEFLRQVLPLLVVIGVVHIAPEKLAGLISIISLAMAFISTTVIRSQVSPNNTVATALSMPQSSTEAQLKTEIAKQN